MKISAKAPCRVDLAGGTLDIWPLYLHHANAATVNFAVDRYASCVLETRGDKKILLCSHDQGAEEQFSSLAELQAASKYRLALPARLIRFFAPETGLNLHTDSESPVGAGIAGSSALIITISSALNRLTRRGYSIERIREVSQNIEAQIIKVPTGCQDYYPAMYGGVSAIELRPDGIHRLPIDVDLNEFNERIVLAYTGVPRNSGINNWEVTKAHVDGDRKVYRNFERIAAIAHGMRAALARQDWNQVGRMVREEWSFRRTNSPGITTPLIDRLVGVARRSGAIGAKVCGAGGGGCVFFLVQPGAKQKVQELVRKEGASVLDVRVAPRGVQVKVTPN